MIYLQFECNEHNFVEELDKVEVCTVASLPSRVTFSFNRICDRKLLSCDRKLVSCDGKNRCVPYEPLYNLENLVARKKIIFSDRCVKSVFLFCLVVCSYQLEKKK